MMPAAIRCAAGEMLAELESSCLEVVLVPERRRTCEGDMIRVAASRNASWYQRFCAAYPSSRFRRNAAPDTRIKRAQTIQTLARIEAGEFREGLYFSRLWAVCEARVKASRRASA